MENQDQNAWLAEIEITGFYRGKPRYLSQWRSVLADIIGAPIRYAYKSHRFTIPTTLPNPPRTLEFLEAEVTSPDWPHPITPGIRAGLWDTTPEEPLLILLLATIPGATFYARHAAAIAERLDEIDELVHHVGQGWVTSFHELARQAFATQARTGRDMTSWGGYEPTGWWRPQL